MLPVLYSPNRICSIISNAVHVNNSINIQRVESCESNTVLYCRFCSGIGCELIPDMVAAGQGISFWWLILK